MAFSSPSPLEHAKTAIRDSRPPVTDDLTYLTIVQSHLSPELLPALNDVLQDVELTQRIGWDLVHMLLPLPGSAPCLKTVARLGNPREVILQVTEALRLLVLDQPEEEEDNEATEDKAAETEDVKKTEKTEEAEPTRDALVASPTPAETPEPTEVDKFCLLVSMLATLHPRIKTKYPSRFLSASLMAILSSYRPSSQATHAITAFAQTLSGNKRPPLPTRKSSLSIQNLTIASDEKDEKAPDPEAAAEDPKEEAIQKKLVQSFVTHIIELYVKDNSLDWSARLQEHFAPDKIVPGKKNFGEAFREDLELQEREVLLGKLVALARDVGLNGVDYLFNAPGRGIFTSSSKLKNNILFLPFQVTSSLPPTTPNEPEGEDFAPTSPEDVPLSLTGCLFLTANAIFSSVMFSNTNVTLPALSIFPSLSLLVQKFIGTTGLETSGTESPPILDAILSIGLWLEHTDHFVAGPLDPTDYLQLLQSLSLVSANCPEPTLRHAAHILTSNILHAHPTDRLRLNFISDTLEHCPFEPLRASAVGWLKEELVRAHTRKSDDLFGTPAAVAALQPYLFPYESVLDTETDSELLEDFRRTFPFHMAALNLIFFLNSEEYKGVVPEGSMSVIEEVYLMPLRTARGRLAKALKEGGEMEKVVGAEEARGGLVEVRLLGDRLDMCLEQQA
ncbi:hypothetical protein V499_06317 [Pseudogymnoascus sp. VKM F-103]|nr:hypothetical protein V499_06317 [Pseudogymnoascus sp. VKM F-103]